MMKKNVFFFFLLSIFACTNTPSVQKETSKTETPDAFKNCKYGAPKPIFTEASPEITYHTFVLSKAMGIENVNFKDGTLLDIEQTGCDYIQQQYTFTFKGNFSKLTDAEWKTKSVEWFHKIAGLSQKYFPFKEWGDSINDAASKLHLGEEFELQKGADYTASIKIDKIVSATEAKLIVTEIIR